MEISERFLKYVSYGTNSDEESDTTPSSACQLELGKYIADELKIIGLCDAHIDENGYVYGFLPATKGCDKLDTVGFIAHMDTSPAVCGDNIKPQVVKYKGGDIKLSKTESIKLKNYPFLEKYLGQSLIVTDGTTLLGADDKAGAAEIITACEYLIEHPEVPHRAISVCITPDEEIGRGADHFDIKKFAAKWAYTIDGGELGEIEYENFNAAAVKITVNGINIHPGTAKNKMKNAVLLANSFISALPPAETPAHTENYEGFYHVTDISGNESLVKIALIIRDHDLEKFKARKKFIENLVAYLNSVYGDGTFILDMHDSYYNMKEKILPHIHIVDRAKEAMLACGVEPIVVPIRGGTDGALLSYKGLPCPNLSTGGGNFHSIHEFVSIDAMQKMTEIILKLMTELK